MTPEQLNLLGGVERPEDDQLGPVQRAALRVLRRLGTLHRDEAGAIAHAHRGKHGVDERCAYCSTDGAVLLESLVRRRQAERAPEGAVQLPRPRTDSPGLQGPGDLPEGY